MKVLGLDLGSKTIGISLSDALKVIASGIETYHFKENHYSQAAEYIISFCKENNVSEIVLGQPKNMDGTIGERGKISENFAKRIQEKLDIPIILWDERLTTVSANKMLIEADVSRKKRKKVVDKIAATLILQTYLDSKN